MAARFRHEDVSAVPKGWKVRTVTHERHRVRVAFPPGRREKGSGRLVSILHPIGENPCTLRSANPSELLVMGANPPRKRNPEARQQRLFAKHQIRIAKETLRMPDQVAAVMGGMSKAQAREILQRHGVAFKENPRLNATGVGPGSWVHTPGRSEIYRVVEMQGGHGKWRYLLEGPYPSSGRVWTRTGRVYLAGDPRGHNPGMELVVMGANPPHVHTAAPGVSAEAEGNNPPAAEIFEGFTGRESEWVTVTDEPHIPRGDYAQLGDLLNLYVKPAGGGQILEIRFKDRICRPIVVCDRSARQIYFVGGDQDISESLSRFNGNTVFHAGVYTLGEGIRIDYRARKDHVAEPDEDKWKHYFGEENGKKPKVLFDSRHKRILLDGGDYRIDGAWIRN